MRKCIAYVLKDSKIKDELVYIAGPYLPEEINVQGVYDAFMDEKELWNKTEGRMYVHSVISFHAKEKITPEEALEFGKEFVDKWYDGFQTLAAVHQNRRHIHIHMVTNTVSYMDGSKYHMNRGDLAKMKEITNDMCRERGLSVAQKGRHFDGTLIAPGTVISWSKDKYRMLTEKAGKSYLQHCGKSIQAVMHNPECVDKESFIRLMQAEGWKVNWSDRRSHITFENEEGKKVRDTNILKTFGWDVTKETLEKDLSLKVPVVTEKSTIEEILKAYMIKRKAGRTDWAELPRKYALSNDLSRVSTLILFAQNNNLIYLGEAKKLLAVVEDDIEKMKSSLADLQKAKATIEEAIEALGPLKKYKPAYDDYQSGVISKWVIGHFMEKDIKAYEEAKAKVDVAAKYGKTDKKSLKAMLKKIDSEISQTKAQIQLKDMDAEILTDIQEFAGWVLPKKEKVKKTKQEPQQRKSIHDRLKQGKEISKQNEESRSHAKKKNKDIEIG